MCRLMRHTPTSANLLQGLGAHAVHGLANVGGLLLNVNQHLQTNVNTFYSVHNVATI